MRRESAKAREWWAIWLGLNLCGAAISVARAQLAITEVMASATRVWVDGVDLGRRPDFWELTNFATNSAVAIDLAGYSFTDNKPATHHSLVNPEDPPLSIAPGESVLFVCSDSPLATNEWNFREWWSAGLPPEVKVRFYGTNPGLGGGGDSVCLYDPEGVLVDAVDFGDSQEGVSFTYDTNGEFGAYSVLGICGAFRAGAADDIGSPGVTCGPVPLSILEQPTNQFVSAGLEAIFSVQVAGLPRPRYQWQHEGTNLSSATQSSLAITNVQAADVGEYAVELNNGLITLLSASARLVLVTNPAPPEILERPLDLQVFDGQNARFATRFSGEPLPSLQWLANDVPLTGETNWDLVIYGCTPDLAGTIYCVQLSNVVGTARACARLDVIPRPLLEVTEVMANPVGPGQDWFELTSFETNITVDLRGWRFTNDWDLGTFDLQTASVVTQAVCLRPGESIIFVRNMTPQEFADWWGPDKLPAGLQVITASNLSLSSSGADLFLWNAAAEDPTDFFIGRSFNPCQTGISLESFPEDYWMGGHDSEPGRNGAFYAAQGPDTGSHALGSPGYVRNPDPRFLCIQHGPSGVFLKWHAVTGKNYYLWCKDALSDANWRLAGTYMATNATACAEDISVSGTRQRFYFLEQWP